MIFDEVYLVCFKLENFALCGGIQQLLVTNKVLLLRVSKTYENHMKRHKIKACCYGAELDLSQTCISGLSLKLGITSPDLRKLNIENYAEVDTLLL